VNLFTRWIASSKSTIISTDFAKGLDFFTSDRVNLANVNRHVFASGKSWEVLRASIAMSEILKPTTFMFRVGQAVGHILYWLHARMNPETRRRRISVRVPDSARFLLLLIPRKDRDNLVGDLEEEFLTRVLPAYGPKLARRWYWAQTIATLFPIVCCQVKRIARLAVLWEIVRRWV